MLRPFMQRDDLISLTNRLLWGTAATRRQLAEDLLRPECQPELVLLAGTVRSHEAWRLRARCLEVLGMMAGEASQEVAEQILRLLAMSEMGPRALQNTPADAPN